jgi:hypothetical protein
VAMCSGMPLRTRDAGAKPVAQGGCVRRRGRLVNRDVEGREDRAHLLRRHGAGPRELLEGRSVEARQHDAEAPLQLFTSSSTSGAGAPAVKAARVIRASCKLSRRERPGLNSFTT